MIRRHALGVLTAVVVAATAVTAVGVVDHASRPLEDDRYALLVMGSDMGPWRSGSVLGGRADAMHLVVVTPSERSASILSFPRDLWVPVPGMGTTRINSSLTRGPETAVETVEELTGVEIDDWIVTGMRAFLVAVDQHGGLEVDVPQRLRIDGTTVDAGRQRLDGIETLVYGRDRKSRSDGDFGRNRAQAEILALLHEQLLDDDPTPAELFATVATLRANTVSSIPPARMLVLAGAALDVDPDRVVRAQVPGVNARRGEAAVVVATSGADELFADLRDDGMLTP